MGWLKRLFGLEKPQDAQVNPTPQPVPQAATTATQSIPPERLGLNGEYDQSGLAKRVALAFDQDQQLDDVNTLWVAQTGSTVVLKGKVPSQDILNKMTSVARSVNGATDVDTNQVTIG
ncbi:phospholipid-binding protein [Nostoc sp. CENA67]|uniref:Phospholipid-binding protein n=1 Tax=Amazonocrinis nigriterrae CENA67 TaxID=2794033 RepID=A0A8J7HRW0_9NOST|nr:BON domain-containing protein [Amazonocrinis nigriterrae]MBH8562367.1 phospholipid-binding protein [Amazonocrinis nigriterrae CENA67]MBH8562412.1 phospholipid-binding protein [Amazonocrinis nigriterrae CENA67]